MRSAVHGTAWTGVDMVKRLLAILLLAIYTSTTLAGRLDDFEEQASTRPPQADSHESTPDDDIEEDGGDAGESDDFADFMAELLFYATVAGGVMSMQRVVPNSLDDETYVTARELGEPLIPMARVDASYQYIDSDLYATDARAEVGFGLFGFQYRRSDFEESDPNDSLVIKQWHGLYRMSFGDYVEVDLGYGRLRLEGNAVSEGSSYTMPVHIHLNEYLGFEWRPAWSSINGSNIREDDVAILLLYRYTSLRLGYRSLKAQDVKLDGPYMGLAVHF